MSEVVLNINSNLPEAVKGFVDLANAGDKLNDVLGETGRIQKSVSDNIEKDAAKNIAAKKKQNTELKKEVGIINTLNKDVEALRKKRDAANSTKEIKKYNKQIDQQEKKLNKLNGSTNLLSEGFKKVGAAIVAAFGVSQIISFTKGSIEAFREQEKAVKKVEQALISTGNASGLSLQQLRDEASDLQGVTLFGDEQILNDATAQLLTFTNIAGENFKRTQKVALDLATVLDGDLQSSSIQLGKALNDPVANLSALSRSGIQFSEDQKKVIKSLAETGRLSEAQGVILAELEKQYGGQAEAAAEVDGGFTQLSNTFGDFQEKVGEVIVDALKPLIGSLKTFFENISKEDIEAFISTLVKLGGAAVTAFTAFKAFQQVKSFGSGFLSAAKGATSFGSAIKGIGSSLAANPFGAILTAIPLVIGAFKALNAIISSFEKELTDAELKQKTFSDAQKEAIKSTAKESSEIDRLVKVARDENLSKEQREDALKRLNEISPKYFTNLSLEESSLASLTQRSEAYVKSLQDVARQKALNAKLEEQSRALIDAETSGLLDNVSGQEVLFSSLSNLFGSKTAINELNKTAIKNREETVNGIQREIDATNDLITAEEKAAAFRRAIDGVGIGLAGDLALTPDQVAQIDAQERAKGEARKKAAKKEAAERKKLEEELIRELAKLQEDADKQRIENIEDPIEKLKAQRSASLQELESFENDLIAKAKRLGKELTDEQLEQIQLLKDSVAASFDTKIQEVELDIQLKANQDLQNSISEEIGEIQQLEALDISAVELELKRENGEAEIDFEKRKADAITAIKIQAAEEQIEALRRLGGIENETRANQLEKTVQELEESKKEAEKLVDEGFLGKLFGVSPESAELLKGQLQELGQVFISEFQALTESQIAANQELVNSLDGRIDKQEQNLDRQIELNKLGFASDIEGTRDTIDNLKKQREDALKEQEKLQKKQAALDALTRVSSIATAVAKLIAAESGKGLLAIPILAAAIPLLFGLFNGAKSQAQASAGFKEGGYTGDIGVNQVAGEVHGQEFVHTAEKTKKHRRLFEAIHNDDTSAINTEVANLLMGTGVIQPTRPSNKMSNAISNSVKESRVAESNRQADRIAASYAESLKELRGINANTKAQADKSEHFETSEHFVERIGSKTIRRRK